jgi:inhibitor of KinA
LGTYKLTYKPFGERAILVEWPQVIDKAILKDIIHFKEKIRNNSIKSLVELKSAYNSLLIVYDDSIKNFKAEMTRIDEIYRTNKATIKMDTVLWKIPVCYDPYFGIDLDLISKEKGLTEEAVVKLHSDTIYTVYFTGFLPGFLYLGGLNEKIHMPRKSSPRLKIEKGSVAIGGNQTGVYPSESPGGWNIIGNSPIDFFDVNKEKPCFAKAGDGIVFYPISRQEYKNMKALVDAGVFQLESEVMDD